MSYADGLVLCSVDTGEFLSFIFLFYIFIYFIWLEPDCRQSGAIDRQSGANNQVPAK